MVLCSAQRPAQHFAAIAGWMSQSDWELHMATDNFESGGEDWPDAYRHSHISGREESYGCAVTWWHHEWQQPAFQPYNSLRLQSNAIPGLWKPWEGAFLGMVSMYFDDANLVDWASSKGA